MSAIITVQYTVGLNYRLGDYARLHGNSGSGEIDWDTPITGDKIDIFPDGAGIYGYGHYPYGHNPYGHAAALGVAGYGHYPYGHNPYGYGAVSITSKVPVTRCGDYKFGFKVYDAAGNAHTGTPGEVTAVVHIAPPAPRGLKLNSYDPDTDILTLDILT